MAKNHNKNAVSLSTPEQFLNLNYLIINVICTACQSIVTHFGDERFYEGTAGGGLGGFEEDHIEAAHS